MSAIVRYTPETLQAAITSAQKSFYLKAAGITLKYAMTILSFIGSHYAASYYNDHPGEDGYAYASMISGGVGVLGSIGSLFTAEWVLTALKGKTQEQQEIRAAKEGLKLLERHAPPKCSDDKPTCGHLPTCVPIP